PAAPSASACSSSSTAPRASDRRPPPRRARGAEAGAMDLRNLAGRTALVTGAASGIGRATALELARRGADLALCDLDAAGLEETAQAARALGREVIARRTDVAEEDSMRAFAGAVHERVPAVDLLVNNAGVALGGGFLDTTLEDWDWIVG